MTNPPRFLLLVLIALVGWTVVADQSSAQTSGAIPHVGIILVGLSEDSAEATAFTSALREHGYVDGQSISLTWRSGRGSYDHLSEVVADLLKRRVDLIVVESTPAALAAKRATSQIPIVMALVGDPVGAGLVESLARPGGRITGLTNQTREIATKRLELLHEAMPKATRVAVLFNPDVAYTVRYVGELEAAARALKLKLTAMSVKTTAELESALSRLGPANTDAILPVDDAFMTSRGALILQTASKARLPVFYADTALARQGVLLSYAVDHSSLFRRAADYVDKILKGASPATLPIEQPTKFVLAVNLRTAKSLGLTIPESVLLQADEVIR